MAQIGILTAERTAMRRLALLYALWHDMQGEAGVPQANAYRLLVKWLDDPQEYNRAFSEMREWIERGLQV